jgi:molybdopterin synthase catalytic subunit
VPKDAVSPDVVDISLQVAPLDVAAAVHRVTCPEAGGMALFLGVTRAESADSHPSNDSLGALLALDYQSYEQMAQKELHRLAAAAAARWPICRLVVWHRLGEVKVGEPSVIIAVSCPHRAEAFDACEFLIDELKKTVPIWKREVFQGGERWR